MNDKYHKKCKSIWIRARHNAFAHKVTMERLRLLVWVEESAITLFIIVPIFCISVSLHYATTSTSSPQLMGFSLYTLLAITGIASNVAALYLTMMSKTHQFREKWLQNQKSLSGYQLIAQKVRRLDESELDESEVEYLIRHLEESFETHKSYANEPSDSDFEKGRAYLASLVSYPFSIKKEDFL
ncbi:hypothetical protein [Neptunomonas concharum]|uniref:SLATT domain-containing protein n=1 Tax=Neptunomonas concharum TaxID=1031538 RepID=A0A5P1RB64_9GAMM|nr:hypothetical protein [Neptunomonas concharum]QEQ96526.1 hypothetical protein F0U83_07290 [Neptunomonas concharum]